MRYPLALALVFPLVSPAAAQVTREDTVCLDDVCRTIFKEQMPLPKQSQRQTPPQPPSLRTPPPLAARPHQLPPQIPHSEKVAFQISRNDAAAMNLTLNNVQNIMEHYRKMGRNVEIEIVAYGPGLQMMRADTSPGRERLAMMLQGHPAGLRLRACELTMKQQSAVEEHGISLLKGVSRVDLGVAHLVQLQEMGYRTLRP